MANDVKVHLSDEGDCFRISAYGGKNTCYYNYKTLPAAYEMIQRIVSILSLVNEECEIIISPNLETAYKSYAKYAVNMELHDLVKNGIK